MVVVFSVFVCPSSMCCFFKLPSQKVCGFNRQLWHLILIHDKTYTKSYEYLEYGGTLTKLFMHVSSPNMFPTTRNLQIRVHVYRPRHYYGD